LQQMPTRAAFDRVGSLQLGWLTGKAEAQCKRR
jgi:hypothetical protein